MYVHDFSSFLMWAANARVKIKISNCAAGVYPANNLILLGLFIPTQLTKNFSQTDLTFS